MTERSSLPQIPDSIPAGWELHTRAEMIVEGTSAQGVDPSIYALATNPPEKIVDALVQDSTSGDTAESPIVRTYEDIAKRRYWPRYVAGLAAGALFGVGATLFVGSAKYASGYYDDPIIPGNAIAMTNNIPSYEFRVPETGQIKHDEVTPALVTGLVGIPFGLFFGATTGALASDARGVRRGAQKLFKKQK